MTSITAPQSIDLFYTDIGWGRPVQFILWQKIILHTDKLINTVISTLQINIVYPT
jgi:hypothetical protein